MEFGLSYSDGNSRTKINTFGGLNRTRNGGRNEFADMYNMSANEYPCLAPQGSRLKLAETSARIRAVVPPDSTNVTEVTGITGVYGGGFYYNGVLKSYRYNLNDDWKWQVEQKGNMYIINGYDEANKKSSIFYYSVDEDEFNDGGMVMRDLILCCGSNYIDTVNTDDYGIYNHVIEKEDGTTIKNSDFFTRYKKYTQDGKNYDTTMSSTTNIFQQYFEIGDELTIEGFAGTNNNGQIWNILSEEVFPQPNMAVDRNNTIDTDNMISTDSLKSIDIIRVVVTGFAIVQGYYGRYTHRLHIKAYDKNGNETSLTEMTSGNYYCSGVTIKKKARVLDKITIHHGRIWGSIPSGNQIYASPSDDIFSFTAEDVVKKYGVRIPSDTPGMFTAMCSYNNDLIAFKNDSMTIISGTNPINYSTSVISGIGCISPESVAVTPDGVIFLSYNGFYIYNGGLPQRISDDLNKKYSSAVSGFDGTSYYTSAVTVDDKRELLVYNMRYGIWYKEDNLSATGFFKFGSDFYITDEYALYKTNADVPDNWSFTFTRTHDNSLDNKGVNEIWIRAEISDGAEFRIDTAADNGSFIAHTTFNKAGLLVYRCPVKLRVEDSYQIKVSGSGKVVFYEFEIRKPDGGRRYKER